MARPIYTYKNVDNDFKVTVNSDNEVDFMYREDSVAITFGLTKDRVGQMVDALVQAGYGHCIFDG